MNAQLLKTLLEAKSHLKKSHSKLIQDLEDEHTDKLVCNSLFKVQDAMISLDRAILRIQEME